MTLAFTLTLLALGFFGAFVAGLLGVGGAIVMIPLLLYAPPLLEVGALIWGAAVATAATALVPRHATCLSSAARGADAAASVH